MCLRRAMRLRTQMTPRANGKFINKKQRIK
jgi:hypothetical protein